jgi:type II secretory ATPase GspE/PulE/Tfp pilus assembly ATPase PilB-like protein
MASSIADLLNPPKNPIAGQPSAQESFAKKMEEIRRKQKEADTVALAAKLGLDYVNLERFPVVPEALALIPREQARANKVIAFVYTGKEVRLGVVDPANPAVAGIAAQVGEHTHANVKTYVISEYSFEVAERLYDALPEIKAVVKGIQLTKADLDRFAGESADLRNVTALVEKATVTDFLAIIIAAAVNAKASDVHIEAEQDWVVVRYRLDGVLNDVAKVPQAAWPRIVSRIKLVSGLKLSVTTVPQDGRFTIFIGKNEDIDVRVSTLPTAFGESVVLRLLMPGTIGLSFDQLGVRGKAAERLAQEIARPHGMIVTTGPTGSGKTTTLYAVLKKLNDAETKIVTLEDPIEYRLERVNQSQIDKSKDYTFAKGLTSILRQDPDVIMVGEIRDLETAEVAIQAALTGHLMLSTIHTNDAAGAIPRFLSMGVKPFLLAPALNAIIGQRLARRIHDACKEKLEPAPEELAKARKILEDLSPASGETPDLANLTFWHGRGCEGCGGIGFKGRVGLYEILGMDKEIEEVVLSGKVSEYAIADLAKKQGMVTMAQDGILKALDGLTTIDEVFRVAE